MMIDFEDKPVENEFDRMFDYDVDGVLSPLEQADKLDFMTGDAESYNGDDYDSGSPSYLDDDDDDDDGDDCGYYISEEEIRKQEEMLKSLNEAQEARKARSTLIVCGIIIAACFIFASSPGIILFIGGMLFSAKLSKIF